MINKFVDYNDGIIAIEADGCEKYGLHILINDYNYKLVNSVTKNRWSIIKIKDNYFAYFKKGDKLIFMQDIITDICSDKCKEKFLNVNGTSKLVLNPYKNRYDLIRHKNNNGLVNTEDNLIISEENKFINDNDYSNYLIPCLSSLSNEDIYDLNLQTILNIDDNDLKKKALEIYKYYVFGLQNNRVFKREKKYIDDYANAVKLYDKKELTGDDLTNIKYSITDFCNDYTDVLQKHESHYYFDGHIITLYPSIKILKANRNHLSCFSGSIIRKNSYYTRYHLFIEDFTDNSFYASDTLKAEVDYESYFPTTVASFDDFMYKLRNCYELGLDEFYNISSNGLGLKLIRKSNK